MDEQRAHHGRYRVEAERLVCLAAASWSYDGSSRAQPRRLKNGTRGHCRRLGTARSSPALSAVLRPALRVRGFRDASRPDSSHAVFAERVAGFGCCRKRGCTANWLRHEGAVRAGRSRRPRRTCVCGAGSTRIHQTGMEKPAIGASATERWSVRGLGMRHVVGPLTTSELNPSPKGEQVLGRNLQCRF